MTQAGQKEIDEAIAWFGRAVVRCGFENPEQCRVFLAESAARTGEELSEADLDRLSQQLYRISRKWLD